MERVTLFSINQYVSATVNPADTPEDLFELYSVPSYENQYPEIVKGKEIGSTKAVVQEGDVLICKINPKINRVWVVKHNTEYSLLASSEWIVVRNSAINSNYLKWYFMSPFFRKLLTSQVAGIGGSLTRAQPKQVAKYPVPIVELEKQEKIVNLLEKVNFVISARQQQLAKLDELVKARFVEMFGDLATPDCSWLSVRLMDTCENQDAIKCGPFGTQLSKEEYKSDGVSVWEIPQINSQFVSSPTHYLTEEKAKQLQSYSICPGDIAMSRKGNVGKCAVFPKEFEPGIIHSDVLRIRVDQKRVLPVFMMCQLHFSKAVQHQIELVSSGAIMAGINVTKLKKIYVHIPPMDLQRRFVAFVESVDKTKLSIQNGLEQMEILKKALMQKYFG